MPRTDRRRDGVEDRQALLLDVAKALDLMQYAIIISEEASTKNTRTMDDRGVLSTMASAALCATPSTPTQLLPTAVSLQAASPRVHGASLQGACAWCGWGTERTTAR